MITAGEDLCDKGVFIRMQEVIRLLSIIWLDRDDDFKTF